MEATRWFKAACFIFIMAMVLHVCSMFIAGTVGAICWWIGTAFNLTGWGHYITGWYVR